MKKMVLFALVILLFQFMTLPARGADPAPTPPDREIVKFHMAVKSGNLVRVKDFLADNPEFINNNQFGGRMPLHEAVIFCHTEVVRLLLEKNADVNAKDTYDRTPLYYAIKNNNQDIINLLRARGAHE